MYVSTQIGTDISPSAVAGFRFLVNVLEEVYIGSSCIGVTVYGSSR